MYTRGVPDTAFLEVLRINECLSGGPYMDAKCAEVACSVLVSVESHLGPPRVALCIPKDESFVRREVEKFTLTVKLQFEVRYFLVDLVA